MIANQGTLYFGGNYDGAVLSRQIGGFHYLQTSGGRDNFVRPFWSFVPEDDCGATTSAYAKKLVLPTAVDAEIFPNPVGDDLQLKFTASQRGSYSVAITNTVGQTVLQSSLSCEQGTCSSNLNVTALPPGVYFINIGGENLSEPLKFVKR